MTAPAFTQNDVEKAIAGVKAHGLPISRVDVNRHTGLISIIIGDGASADPPDEIAKWMAEHGDDRPQGPALRQK